LYRSWGYPFLYETYLYHLHRRDHRHNFSPYFYLTYLTYPSLSEADQIPPVFWRKVLRSPLTSFVPQLVLCTSTGLLFGTRERDLAFAWFVQTVVFVLFNKVCTSQVCLLVRPFSSSKLRVFQQYFVWYLVFIPLLIPRLSMSFRRAFLCLSVWVLTQAAWLADAYRLEFLGDNVFRSLWLKSLVYVTGNAWVLVRFMEAYGAEEDGR
jgi:GPI mannosyltransferase 1 subunit M